MSSVNVEDTLQEVGLVHLKRNDDIRNDQILRAIFFRLSQLPISSVNLDDSLQNVGADLKWLDFTGKDFTDFLSF